MTEAVEPWRLVAVLREQHDQLRDLAKQCHELAAHKPAGEEIGSELRRAVARLRNAWAAHNQYEESVLAPILLATDPSGRDDLREMERGHRHEHVLIRSMMSPTTVRELRHVLGSLRRHLAEEEVWFDDAVRGA